MPSLTPNAATLDRLASQIDPNAPAPLIATTMQTMTGGDTRQAEVYAWKLWERASGGTPFGRPNSDSPLAMKWLSVVRALAFPPPAEATA